MHKLGLTPEEALDKLRESRGVCEPNADFWNQLKMYQDMGRPVDLESEPKYQRWLYQRELDASRAVRQAPEAERIRFEDEHTTAAQTDGAFELKCRRCRYCRIHTDSGRSLSLR